MSGDYLDLRAPEFRRWFYSSDTARDEMNEIEGKLAKLAEQSRPLLPEYAERRLSHATTVQRVAGVLRSHRKQGPIAAMASR